MSRLLPAFLGVLVWAVIGMASAQPQPHGRHTHDGFFLRLSVGFGAVSQSSLSLSSGVVTAGEPQAATMSDFAIGGIVGRNLAVHFAAWSSVLPRKSQLATPSGGALSKQVVATGFGPGLTYYFMPTNLYVTLAAGGATMKVDVSGVEQTFPGGFGMFFGVGKEWWVSDNWALGILGQIAFVRVWDPVGIWNTAWGGISFSATYN